MKRKTFRLTMACLSALLLALMSSCAVYRPQIVEIPLIEQKGDVQLDGSLGITGAHVSVAAGLTDNLAAQAFGRMSLGCNYARAALGLYRPAGNTVKELYAGFGAGNGEYEYTSDADPNLRYTHGGFYNILFLQGNYGWNHLSNDHITLGFGLKLGYMHDELNIWGTNTETDIIEIQRSPVNNRLLVEPSLTFRFGWNRFKFTYNLGCCVMIPNTDMSGLHIRSNIGISYRFGKR